MDVRKAISFISKGASEEDISCCLVEAAKYREKGKDEFREAEYIKKMGRGVVSTDTADYWIRFSSIDKLGVNTHYDFDTPRGMYFYPVTERSANMLANGTMNGHSEIAHFATEQPYMVFAKLKNKAHILYINKYTDKDLQDDLDKLRRKSASIYSGSVEAINTELKGLDDHLKKLYDLLPPRNPHPTPHEEWAKALRDVWWYLRSSKYSSQYIRNNFYTEASKLLHYGSREDFVFYIGRVMDEIADALVTMKKDSGFDSRLEEKIQEGIRNSKLPIPGTKIWNVTRLIADQDAIKWAKILRRELGYSGAIDGGTGTIYSAEPHQAVFFDITPLQFAGSFHNIFNRIKEKRDKLSDLTTYPVVAPFKGYPLAKVKKLREEWLRHIKVQIDNWLSSAKNNPGFGLPTSIYTQIDALRKTIEAMDNELYSGEALLKNIASSLQRLSVADFYTIPASANTTSIYFDKLLQAASVPRKEVALDKLHQIINKSNYPAMRDVARQALSWRERQQQRKDANDKKSNKTDS